ncbi:hypothetical protein [Brassicibacter mesophilus]|uniref:hypothetical protein n=1 Tax=Brassicibacter mesophilus TaxID=745119 RepID=UPI003D1F6E0D
MKQKRNIYVIIEIIILAVVALLVFTVLNTEYLFEWAAHNWKFYFILVVIVLLLIFLNKQLISAFMTAGIVVGIFVGNYLGKLIKGLNEAKIVEGMKAEEVYRLHHNPGFEIWIGIILLSIIIGIITQIAATRKRMKR